MTVDDRIRTTLAVQAGSIAPPEVDVAALRAGGAQIRRRRRTASVALSLAAAVVAVVAAGVLLAGGQTHRSSPQPIAPPTPAIPGGEVLAAHPWLAGWELPDGPLVRQVEVRPPRLTHCVDNPRTWGAVESQGATWTKPTHPSTRVNEFLLQYADATTAHQAFLGAVRQLRHCRSVHPSEGGDLNGQLQTMYAKAYDEGFGWQRLWYTTPHPTNQPSAIYAFRVARAGNVLVVVEDTGIPSDRTPYQLATAVQQALPHYRWGG
jgi:hypothetical protein